MRFLMSGQYKNSLLGTIDARVYEMKPGLRTISVDKSHYGGVRHYYRVLFPWTYFLIMATREPLKYSYLFVGFRNSPLRKTNHRLSAIPLTNSPNGWVCLGTTFENQSYPNWDELAHSVIDGFFSSPFTDDNVFLPLKNGKIILKFDQWHDFSKNNQEIPVDLKELSKFKITDFLKDIVMNPHPDHQLENID